MKSREKMRFFGFLAVFGLFSLTVSELLATEIPRFSHPFQEIVSEGAGEFTVRMNRNLNGDLHMKVQVDFNFVYGRANIGDYEPIDHHMVWSEGTGGELSFSFRIIDDSNYEGDEDFQIQADIYVGNDNAYHSTKFLRVIIEDNDEAPSHVLGDTNGDCVVNLDDLNAVRNKFGYSGPNLPADVNFDWVINIDDLNIVRNNFGATCSSALQRNPLKRAPAFGAVTPKLRYKAFDGQFLFTPDRE